MFFSQQEHMLYDNKGMYHGAKYLLYLRQDKQKNALASLHNLYLINTFLWFRVNRPKFAECSCNFEYRNVFSFHNKPQHVVIQNDTYK